MPFRRTAIVLLAMAVVIGLGVLPSAAAVGQPGGARPGVVGSSTWLLRNTLSAGPSDMRFTFGLPGDRKVMGDWNGDGIRTPGVFRNGTWYLRDRNGAGGTYFSVRFGDPGDMPVVGDWNGDGIETIGFLRGRDWHLRDWNSTGPSQYIFSFGRPGDVPVAGDWNGDGVDTIGVFRAGAWYLRNVNTAGPAQYVVVSEGAAGDTPVVGVWDRNGADSIGFFRRGGWHLRNTISGGPSDVIFGYGSATDTPVVWRQVVASVPRGLAGTEWEALPTTRKVVALTFDAGANADAVPKILATLASNRVAGDVLPHRQGVELFPGQTKQIGTYYPIGNHTYSHPDLTTLTDAQVRDHITRAAALITSATAQDPRPLFRFPLGARDARTIGIANSRKYGSIRWTVDTLGWQGTSGGRSVQSVVDRVLAGLRPGAIILMHVGSNPDDHSMLDADALQTVINQLRARGYTFTTVRQYS